MNQQITSAAHILRGKGYARTGDPATGSLREGESTSLTLTLRAGTSYAVIGVCDNDCSDFELRLYDANDHEVDSDTQSRDVPTVRVTPRETNRYTLKMVMMACRTSPCFYGVGVFSKDN